MLPIDRTPGPETRVFSGRCSILPFCGLLQEFAEHCGQATAMHGLSYFLEKEERGGKHAYLVLRLAAGTELHRLSPVSLLGAALLFEYRPMGYATGAFVGPDLDGFRAVIAPEASRGKVAALAAAALVGHGAHLVLASFAGSSSSTFEATGRPDSIFPKGRKGVLLAVRERQLPQFLKLGSSYEATLATLGKSTRFNLRYYRRRLQAEHGAEFLPEAARMLSGSEIERFNARSLNPLPAGRFARAWEAASLPGGFLCGLRSSAGEWLSFIGGWRQGSTTLIQWQCNASGFEKLSLTTVMRSFFLEHEVQRGAETLVIPGGTPHSLQHSFQTGPVTDLLVRRKTVRSAVLAIVARGLMSSSNAERSRGSFVAEMLFSPDVTWRSGDAGSPPRRSQPSLATRAASTGLKALASHMPGHALRPVGLSHSRLK